MENFCKLHVVYWIHTSEHTDINTQGYVGVTSNPDRRWRDHKSSALYGTHTNKHLANAINKYGDDLLYTIITVGSKDYCFNYEATLRPSPSIGWNIMAGGRIGKISEEGLKKLREKASKPLSQAQKERNALTRYNKKHGTNLTKKQYLDQIAIENNQLPPSKADIPIFSLTTITEYPSIEHASKVTGYDPTYILEQCESKKSTDWIYLKNL